ncbi:RES family NAD+ phosphorylase [Microvirga massiliensis]|uniref:RES family NAD+ phosphorylase n=1 Tax=Microvirga massiliensis TaxID=1033741 RepID=UPI000660508C|nr:RES family NAD+ phosphorylase [Microvirga massiliensis]
MAPKPGSAPPADFAARDLPIETVPASTTFVRIHRSSLAALYFGTSGDNRFDDPEGHYGVCYAARSLAGAFVETCLREVGVTLVPLSRLAERSATELVATAELRLVELHGPGLARVGATAAVSSGTYDISQPWSRAIHGHPANVDGIVYRSNHDNGELCVALFDRCRDRLRPGSRTGLMADRAALAELLDRYRIGLS